GRPASASSVMAAPSPAAAGPCPDVFAPVSVIRSESPAPRVVTITIALDDPRVGASRTRRHGPATSHTWHMASYRVSERAVARARKLIDARQYVLDSDWGEAQPRADDENAYLASHSWQHYGEWHLALPDSATDETKARY